MYEKLQYRWKRGAGAVGGDRGCSWKEDGFIRVSFCLWCVAHDITLEMTDKEYIQYIASVTRVNNKPDTLLRAKCHQQCRLYRFPARGVRNRRKLELPPSSSSSFSSRLYLLHTTQTQLYSTTSLKDRHTLLHTHTLAYFDSGLESNWVSQLN